MKPSAVMPENFVEPFAPTTSCRRVAPISFVSVTDRVTLSVVKMEDTEYQALPMNMIWSQHEPDDVVLITPLVLIAAREANEPTLPSGGLNACGTVYAFDVLPGKPRM